MTLTEEQYRVLNIADRTGKCPTPTELKLVPGFHFCMDWDNLPICDDSPEKEACLCRVKNK